MKTTSNDAIISFPLGMRHQKTLSRIIRQSQSKTDPALQTAARSVWRFEGERIMQKVTKSHKHLRAARRRGLA